MQAAQFVSFKAAGDPVIGVRVTGERTWGQAPFLDAAALGGAETLRGLRSRRFTGSHLLAGTAEARLTLGQVAFVLPSTVGLLGVTDFGRVFMDGERSGRWHTGVGAGIWMSVLSSQHAVSVLMARSAEGHALYARLGLGL
jgi:hypothetical protein